MHQHGHVHVSSPGLSLKELGYSSVRNQQMYVLDVFARHDC